MGLVLGIEALVFQIVRGVTRLVVGAGVTVIGYRLWLSWRRRLVEVTEDFAAYWRRRARRTGQLSYVALGDSLAQGLTACRPELGYVGRLADAVAAGTGRTVGVRNLSVTGASVADVLERQLPALLALPRRPDVLTVCVGSNDVAGTPPELFRERFGQLCARLPAGALVADVPTIRHGPHRRRAAELAAICAEVLGEFPALVPVSVHAATAGMRFWELGFDLVHPGALGYRRYTAAFAAALPDEFRGI
jgi:acyl-CoA thioesterase I